MQGEHAAIFNNLLHKNSGAFCQDGTAPLSLRLLLRRDHIVVHGLAAGEEADLRVGAGGGKDGLGLLPLLLGDILAIEDRDELRALVGVRPGQPVQQGIQVLVGAEELVLLQGQIVPLVDGKAVEVGVPGGIGDLDRKSTRLNSSH